jgi:MoxR-like ATPase
MAKEWILNSATNRFQLNFKRNVGPEDVRFAAYPVLRHRIVTSFNAEADGVDTEEIIKRVLETVKEQG